MKMETPNKYLAQGSLNTLKKALQDENYIKAMNLMIQAHKNAIKNGLYSTDYEWQYINKKYLWMTQQ